MRVVPVVEMPAMALELAHRFEGIARALKDADMEVAACAASDHGEASRAAGLRLHQAMDAARRVDSARISRENPDDVPGAIRRARLVAIAALQAPTGH